MGLDNICSDPQYDFLSLFSDEDDSVPDSFFTNNHCSPYTDVDLTCSYIETEKIKNLDPEKFTVLSLNIQSLPAKFTEFAEFLSEFPDYNSCPEVICIQETWQVSDNSLFPLTNYHPLETNLRHTARGGWCWTLH